MLYIQQSLGPEEELVYVGRFHWMFTAQAFTSVIWGVALSVLVIAASVFFYKQMNWFPEKVGWLATVQYLHPGLRILSFAMLVFGFMGFLSTMVIKATTEIAVTNSRVVYKQGLIARQIGEISIDRIEGVNILQSILGRIFNYGRVAIRGMGLGEVVLPPIAEPLKFRQAVEEARLI